MTLEGANKTMKRRGNKVKSEVNILERLQNIRAMLVEVRESLGDTSPVEYEAPIEAVTELIADVRTEAKAHVVEVATTLQEEAVVEEPKTEEPVAEQVESKTESVEPAEPRRRGRPRKVEGEEQPDTQVATRRRAKRAKDENKELFPFYEQSLF